MRKAVISLLLLTGLAGCGEPKELDMPEYLEYMEQAEAPYKKLVKAGNLEYTVQYANPEYMVSRQFAEQADTISALVVTNRLQEIGKHIFFLIRIQESGGKTKTIQERMEDNGKAEAMNMYYQFEAARDITMIADGVEYKPVTYLFENNYALTPYNTIVAGFERVDGAADVQIVFNDKYHNVPLIKASYSKDELNELPKLIF